jgi:hypothetical protein
MVNHQIWKYPQTNPSNHDIPILNIPIKIWFMIFMIFPCSRHVPFFRSQSDPHGANASACHGTWRADATHCVRSRRAPHGRRQPGTSSSGKLWWKLHSWGCIKKTRQCLEKLRDVSTISWLLFYLRVPTFTHIISYTSFWACGLWFTTIIWFRTS